MLINIDKIQIDHNNSNDLNNIEELMRDIKKNGLINPIVITYDYKLFHGRKRLEACKQLGYSQIEVKIYFRYWKEAREKAEEFNLYSFVMLAEIGLKPLDLENFEIHTAPNWIGYPENFKFYNIENTIEINRRRNYNKYRTIRIKKELYEQALNILQEHNIIEKSI